LLLLWRSYLVWGHKRVILASCSIAILVNVYGCVITFWDWGNPSSIRDGGPGIVYFAIFAIGALISNLLLTVLIAGRILFIAHRVGKYLPFRTSIPRMYRTILLATLESGLIYPIGLIIYATSVSQRFRGYNEEWFTTELIADVAFDSLVTIMGIASTIIIVRVALGIAIYDEQSFKDTILSSIKPTHAQHNRSESIIDICQHAGPAEESSLSQRTVTLDLEGQTRA
ncbi:hypothetical protein PQX77_016240, partial [Marasmius sp. AFHP31]